MYDEAEMNTWMESLTGDPGMAALLGPIVAPSQVCPPQWEIFLTFSVCLIGRKMGSLPGCLLDVELPAAYPIWKFDAPSMI